MFFSSPLGWIVIGQQDAGRKQRSSRLMGGMTPVHICGYQHVPRQRGMEKPFKSMTPLGIQVIIIENQPQRCHPTLRISEAVLSLQKATAGASLKFLQQWPWRKYHLRRQFLCHHCLRVWEGVMLVLGRSTMGTMKNEQRQIQELGLEEQVL